MIISLMTTLFCVLGIACYRAPRLMTKSLVIKLLAHMYPSPMVLYLLKQKIIRLHDNLVQTFSVPYNTRLFKAKTYLSTITLVFLGITVGFLSISVLFVSNWFTMMFALSAFIEQMRVSDPTFKTQFFYQQHANIVLQLGIIIYGVEWSWNLAKKKATAQLSPEIGVITLATAVWLVPHPVMLITALLLAINLCGPVLKSSERISRETRILNMWRNQV